MGTNIKELYRGEDMNGKLVYFLLTLLVAITSYTGKSIIDTQVEMGKDLTIVKDNVSCLTGNFESYKSLHGFQHKVLDENLRTLSPNGRLLIPTD